MTVVNMLSVKGGGFAVADAQSSSLSTARKYNTSDKLHLMKGNVVYGGTGPTHALDHLYDLSNAGLDGTVGLDGVAGATLGKVTEYIRDEKERVLYANVGITLENLQTGALANGRPLTADTVGTAKSILGKVDEALGLSILLGGMSGEKFRVYAVGSGGFKVRVSDPYVSVGSGADESQKVLSNYVSGLARENRWSIDPISGLVKILEATNASSDINVGVGGSPSIVYVAADKVFIPGEHNCLLASQLVRGLSADQLDRDFVGNAAHRLVTDGSVDYRQVNDEMHCNAKDAKTLDLILRGFKVR